MTTQVHPYKLTKALFENAQAKGVEMIKGILNGVEFEKRDEDTFVKGKYLSVDTYPVLQIFIII